MEKITRRTALLTFTGSVAAVILFSTQSYAAGSKISVTKAYNDAKAGRSLLIDIRRPAEWKKTGVSPLAVPIRAAPFRIPGLSD